jgi:hypothetical protein
MGNTLNSSGGLAMFFIGLTPIDMKCAGTLLRAAFATTSDTVTPSGSHWGSMRAAMFTPSPKTSVPVWITSPMCTPMRMWNWSFAGLPLLYSPMAFWQSSAHCTAFSAERKRTMNASPMVLMTVPRLRTI